MEVIADFAVVAQLDPVDNELRNVIVPQVDTADAAPEMDLRIDDVARSPVAREREVAGRTRIGILQFAPHGQTGGAHGSGTVMRQIDHGVKLLADGIVGASRW